MLYTGQQDHVYSVDPREGSEMVNDWLVVTQQVTCSYNT